MPPVLLILACLLVIALNIPFLFEIVPPNKSYGLHTAETLSDEVIWYKANKIMGWSFVLSCVTTIAALSVSFLFARDLSPYIVEGYKIAAVIVPLSISMFVCFSKLRILYTLLPDVSEEQEKLPSLINCSVSEQVDAALEAYGSRDCTCAITLIPAIVLLLLYICFISYVMSSNAELSERVATHFNIRGEPEGWMSPKSYVSFIVFFGSSLFLVMVIVSFMSRNITFGMYVIPHKKKLC
jgi:uncharacterized membrane protein